MSTNEVMDDPSSETSLTDFGSLYLCEITNNSIHHIKFYNPSNNKTGRIKPGETESIDSKGYFPLWSHPRRYEITYYIENYKEWKSMTLKDLNGNSWLSIEQPGIDEDIRTISSSINLIVKDNGYEIFSPEYSCTQAALILQPRY